MSKKIIRFRGLTLNKDEQAVEPGELALCGNVEMYDGALRPSVLKGTSLAGGANLNGTMIYIHKTTNYTNFITRRNDNSTWTMYSYTEGNTWSGGAISFSSPFSPGDIVSISHVGNTLCILTSAGLFYFICKYNSTQQKWIYQYLGQQPPFLELQFNLHSTESVDTDNQETLYLTTAEDWAEEYSGIQTTYTIEDSQRSTVTEEVMAEINKRIDDVTGEGYFYAPFLIRYAYRMFDGTSLIMHSPPVLLYPMLSHPVMTLVGRFSVPDPTDPGSFKDKFWVFLKRTKLQMLCADVSVFTGLDNWSDVIKGVDIFITPQVSRIDTAGLIKTCRTPIDHNYSIYDGVLGDERSNNSDSVYCNTYLNFAYHYAFDLPEYGEGEHMSHIKNSSSFYKLVSYTIDELRDLFNGSSLSLKEVDFDGSVLRSITAQPQMTDDYKTHNLLKPVDVNNSGSYVYNQRLNLYGIGETLFNGFSPRVMFPYSASGGDVSSIKVYINTNHGVRVVEQTGSPCEVLYDLIDSGYVFYPDDRATHMVIYYDSTHSSARKLEASAFLNGAFSLNEDPNSTVSIPTASTDRFVPMLNKVYTSKSENPFYFPNLPGESGINSVGTGVIVGMAAVTRALSQGQVGDHDLVIFASDGIWVMKVNATGTYSNIHNISREVCVNKASICQLDQSIVFSTDRALNQFVESNVNNISEVLDGPIRSFATLLSGIRTSDSVARALIDFGTPAITLFKNGRVLYDYTGSRLIVFPENTSLSSVCLVYSIRDKAWSTMAIPGIRAVLAGYPCPYVQYYASDDDMDHNPPIDNQHGPVQCLDTPYTYNAQSDVVSGIIMSRTLTFSDTMDVIRGFRQLNDCATMPTIYFFGSNNQRDWQQIGYSARGFHNYMPGHPFRFFRFAIYMQMHTDEKYQEVLLEIINKYAKL